MMVARLLQIMLHDLSTYGFRLFHHLFVVFTKSASTACCWLLCLCLMIFNVWMARVGEWAYLPLILLTTRQQWNLSNVKQQKRNSVMIILGCCTSHFYMDRIRVMNHMHTTKQAGRQAGKTHKHLHNSQNFHWIFRLAAKFNNLFMIVRFCAHILSVPLSLSLAHTSNQLLFLLYIVCTFAYTYKIM